MTPDARREHVLELTDELGAMLVVDEDALVDMGYTTPCTAEDPCGYAYGRNIPFKGAPKMPPVVVLSHEPGVSVTAYFVALHELGHVATDNLARRILDREALAWNWALSASAIDPSRTAWSFIAFSLASYKGCRRCKPSTLYNRLLKRAERSAK